MGMENIWNEINSLHGFKSSQLEEGKAFTIIEISVNMTSEEICLIVYEVKGNTIQDGLLNPTVLSTPSYTHFKVKNILNLVPKLSLYHIIVG